jgi:hypothetical protein
MQTSYPESEPPIISGTAEKQNRTPVGSANVDA